MVDDAQRDGDAHFHGVGAIDIERWLLLAVDQGICIHASATPLQSARGGCGAENQRRVSIAGITDDQLPGCWRGVDRLIARRKISHPEESVGRHGVFIESQKVDCPCDLIVFCSRCDRRKEVLFGSWREQTACCPG